MSLILCVFVVVGLVVWALCRGKPEPAPDVALLAKGVMACAFLAICLGLVRAGPMLPLP